MSEIKNRAVYRLELVPFDIMEGLGHLNGAEVQKVQPYGCPKNGTMGMVYVQHVESGEFIGLVCENSVVRVGRTAPLRDLAAEARDRRSTSRL